MAPLLNEDATATIASLRAQIAHTEAKLAQLRQELDIATKRTKEELKANGNPSYNCEVEDVDDKNGQKWPLLAEEYRRYGRQMLVPEIGLDGQLALRKASVLIVGAGGLGCPAAAYLAGAGIGTLGIVDGDFVEASNLHRQILHREGTIGKLKVDSAIEYLKSLNSRVQYVAHRTHLTHRNAASIIPQYDLVLDCTDHPTSRYLISDSCVIFRKPLVSAASLRTEGQLMVLNDPPRAPGDLTGGPCYRCVFPKPPPAQGVMSCAEGGILGPVVGVMGVLMAVAGIKAITRDKQKNDTMHTMTLFSAYSNPQFRSVKLRGRRANCLSCSGAAGGITLDVLSNGSLNYEMFCGIKKSIKLLRDEERISVKDYCKEREEHPDRKEHLLVDVRDRAQFSICHLENSINVPYAELQATGLKHIGSSGNNMDRIMFSWLPKTLGENVPIYVICRRGNDSQLAVRKLKEMGIDNFGHRVIKDIRGGFRAWREEVDQSWPEY